MKNLLIIITGLSFCLANANSRYAAAHAHFGGKGWSTGMIIGVSAVILFSGGMLVYWYLQSRKEPQKSE